MDYVIAEIVSRAQIQLGLVVAVPGRVEVASVGGPAMRRIVEAIELVEIQFRQETAKTLAACGKCR